MSVYIWMVVLLLLAALLLNGNIRGNRRFIIVAFVLLFAVMGLRDVNTGGSDASGDHGSYAISYENAGNSDWNELSGKGEHNFNLGLPYLMKTIYKSTDGNYQTFISLLSLFFLISYMRFIRRYSPSPIQSVLYFLGLLYYTLLFDALKQAVAMSVLLFAFDAIIDKKPIRFLVLVLLAAQFHFPAMIFLPAYWIGRMKIGNRYLILLAVLLLATYLFRDQILSVMLDVYGNTDLEGSSDGIRFLRNKALVMIIIVIAAVILRPPSEGDTVYNACLVFAGVAIVFQTFCGYNNIFERLADYYFHTSIILLPLIFEKCKLKKHYLNVSIEQTAKSVALWLFCAFSVWRFLSFVDNSAVFNSYKFLWQ